MPLRYVTYAATPYALYAIITLLLIFFFMPLMLPCHADYAFAYAIADSAATPR